MFKQIGMGLLGVLILVALFFFFLGLKTFLFSLAY